MGWVGQMECNQDGQVVSRQFQMVLYSDGQQTVMSSKVSCWIWRDEYLVRWIKCVVSL